MRLKSLLLFLISIVCSGSILASDNKCKDLSSAYSDNLDKFNYDYTNYISTLQSYSWMDPTYIRIKNDVWTSNVLEDKQLIGLGRLKVSTSNSPKTCEFLYSNLENILKTEQQYFIQSLGYAKSSNDDADNFTDQGRISTKDNLPFKFFKELDFNKEAITLHLVDEIRDNTSATLKKDIINE